MIKPKLYIKLNNLFILFLFLLLIILNQFTWSHFFDLDGELKLYSKAIFFIFDIVLILFIILFYLKIRLKTIFINTVLILIIIVTLDLFFGDWLFSNNLNHLNIIKDKALKFEIGDLYETDNIFSEYKKDIYGFRGKYKNISEIDIITIGGSTTEQMMVTEGSTFQDVMMDEYRSDGKSISIVNAGVQGQSTYGHIKNFDWWFNKIPELKTKYFLIYLGVNDVFRDKDDIWDNLTKINSTTKINNFYQLFSMKSIYAHLLRTVIATLHNQGMGHYESSGKDQSQSIEWVKEQKFKNYKFYKKNILDYEKRLRILSNKIKAFGALPIFVTQSHRRVYKFIDGELLGLKDFRKYNDKYINGTDYYHMISLINSSTKKISSEFNGVFIDLNNELNFDLEKDFYDYCHTTANGSKKIGIYLYNKTKHLFDGHK